jgi:hypothetical protein
MQRSQCEGAGYPLGMGLGLTGDDFAVFVFVAHEFSVADGAIGFAVESHEAQPGFSGAHMPAGDDVGESVAEGGLDGEDPAAQLGRRA